MSTKEATLRRQSMAALPPEMDAAIERCADAMQAVLRVWGDERQMREAPKDLPELIEWELARDELEEVARRSGRVKQCYEKLRKFKEYPRWTEKRTRAKGEKKRRKPKYAPKVPRAEWAKSHWTQTRPKSGNGKSENPLRRVNDAV